MELVMPPDNTSCGNCSTKDRARPEPLSFFKFFTKQPTKLDLPPPGAPQSTTLLFIRLRESMEVWESSCGGVRTRVICPINKELAWRVIFSVSIRIAGSIVHAQQSVVRCFQLKIFESIFVHAQQSVVDCLNLKLKNGNKKKIENNYLVKQYPRSVKPKPLTFKNKSK